LDSGAIVPSLVAPTVCKVDEVNSVGVNNREGLGAALGFCTQFGRVMTELEEVTRIPERGFFEVRAVPLLYLLTCQDYAK
jgi:hypothetical protein